MFGEALAVFSIADKITSFLGSSYKKELVKERNVNKGVYECIRMIHYAQPVNVNMAFSETSTLEVSFGPDDILFQVFGGQDVYVTPNEMRYLDGVSNWNTAKVAGVLRFILEQQPLRSQIYNASKNG